jgi:hypothetical protein
MADNKPLSDADIDAITRTVLGESSSDPTERAAVAHVILNRKSMGKSAGFADTINDVVHQPNAFEAWSNKTAPNYPGKFDAKSQDYQQTRQIVEAAANGTLPDPTNGYVHFLEPGTVTGRVNAGKMQWPSWAPPGTGTQIGKQVFYPHENSDAIAAKELESERQQNRQIRSLDASDAAAAKELEEERGRSRPAAPSQQPTTASSAVPADAVPTAPQIGTGQTWQTPADRRAELQRGSQAGTLTSALESARSALEPGVGPPGTLGSLLPRVFVEAGKNALEGAKTGVAGLTDLVHGKNVLPSFDVTRKEDPTAIGGTTYGLQMTDPGAIGRTVGGAAEMTSVPAALRKAEEVVTKSTGNPEIGRTAADILGLLSLPEVRAVASPAARGVNAATSDVIKHIGPEGKVADVAAKMRADPNLSLIDVSEGVMRQTQRYAAKATGDLAQHLRDFVDEREGGERGIAKAAVDAAGQSPEASAALASIKAQQEAVGRQKISPIVDNAKPLLLQPVLKAIDNEFGLDPPGKATARAIARGEKPTNMSAYQQELYDLRTKLTGDNPSRQFLDVRGERGLHQIQSETRADAQSMLKSPDPLQRRSGYRLMALRDKMVGTIDQNNPGYRQALASYREAKEIDDAYRRGWTFTKQKSGLEGELEHNQWQDWSKSATADELKAAQWGALSALKQTIGQMRTKGVSRQLTSIPDIEYSADNLRSLFGKDMADQLMMKLNNAHKRAFTNQALLGNSQTAFRMGQEPSTWDRLMQWAPSAAGGYAGYFIDPEVSALTHLPMSGPVLGAALGKAVSVMRDAKESARRKAYVDMATARGDERMGVLDLLEGRSSGGRLPEKGRDLVAKPSLTAILRQEPAPSQEKR